MSNKYLTKKMVMATFDPSSNGSERPVGAHGLGVTIPDAAIVTNAFVEVVTTFASAGADAGTIALHIEGANDLVAALAISDAANIWDGGIHSTKIPWGATDTYLSTDLTAVAPGGDDFALQVVLAEGGAGNFGFTNANEGDTALSALAAMQTRFRVFAERGTPNFIKTTAAREITATVGAQVLTAGKLNVYVEYVHVE